MISRLFAETGERIWDGEVGQFVERTAIPCHRCGVCCERWQPPVTAAEEQRLAAFLDLAPEQVHADYTVAYPFDPDIRLLRREGRGCVFLRYDADGRTSCAVHPARPDVCREWTSSLSRKECIDGFRRYGADGELVPVATVYPEADERAAFTRVTRGDADT